jgi:hypothetical protein
MGQNNPLALKTKRAPVRTLLMFQLGWNLRDVFIALKAIFVIFDLFLLQFVSGVTHGVFGFADGVAGLAFSLFRQTLGLGLIVAGPLAYLALNPTCNVFSFPFDAFLIHK